MTTQEMDVAPSRRIAAEIRAELARRGITHRAFALMLGKNHMWVTRRIGMTAEQDLTLEELDLIARTLEVPTAKLIADAKWLPRLDSNQQPFGYRAPDAPKTEAA